MEDNLKEFEFDSAKLISGYHTLPLEDFEKDFEEFAQKYYYNKSGNDMLYVRAEQTFHIFSNLIAEKKENNYILKSLNNNPNLKSLILLFKTNNAVTFTYTLTYDKILKSLSFISQKEINELLNNAIRLNLIVSYGKPASINISDSDYALTRKGIDIINLLRKEDKKVW